MNALQERRAAEAATIEALCRVLCNEVAGLGLADESARLADPAMLLFRLERDPASGADCLVGEWQDRHGHRIGMLLLHADGTCFAEHDVVKPHPEDRRWFVEAVQAWGRADNLVSEPRLLPALD